MTDRQPRMRTMEAFDYEHSRAVAGRLPHAPARVVRDHPNSTLPESVASASELGLDYKVLEDWSDD